MDAYEQSLWEKFHYRSMVLKILFRLSFIDRSLLGAARITAIREYYDAEAKEASMGCKVQRADD